MKNILINEEITYLVSIPMIGKRWVNENEEGEKSHNRKKLSLDDIKTMYGCTAFQTNSRMCIA